MLAVDTNILARALVDEGSEESRRATAILGEGGIFIPDTVLLETAWLLRSRLRVDKRTVQALFSALVVQTGVHFADRARVLSAVQAFRRGLDFADAMHLATSGRCDAMLTFDDKFVRRSARAGTQPPVRHP